MGVGQLLAQLEGVHLTVRHVDRSEQYLYLGVDGRELLVQSLTILLQLPRLLTALGIRLTGMRRDFLLVLQFLLFLGQFQTQLLDVLRHTFHLFNAPLFLNLILINLI